VVADPVVALPTDGAQTTAAQPKNQEIGGDEGNDEKLEALASSQSAAASDTNMCDDSGAAPKSCAPLKAPGPQCESFSDTKNMCGKLSRGLRPRVAEKAVDCLLSKSGKQAICDFRAASECALAAVHKACIEPSTQAACSNVVRACSGRLTMNDCQSLLSAVADKHRRAMLSCVTEGCSIDYCMYDIE